MKKSQLTLRFFHYFGVHFSYQRYFLRSAMLQLKTAGLFLFVGVVLLGNGCTKSSSDFPVVSEAELPSGENIYWVCKETDTGKRIYKASYDGGDYVWERLYDENRQVINYAPGISVKVEGCIRTTEEYFKKTVQDDTLD